MLYLGALHASSGDGGIVWQIDEVHLLRTVASLGNGGKLYRDWHFQVALVKLCELGNLLTINNAYVLQHLIEKSWYAVTETCLAFTVFRDDFSPRFVALFTLLLFIKCFHWLVEDRVDYVSYTFCYEFLYYSFLSMNFIYYQTVYNMQMERSPLISLVFHVRVVALLMLLALLDFLFVRHAYLSTVSKGASTQLVFGFEVSVSKAYTYCCE